MFTSRPSQKKARRLRPALQGVGISDLVSTRALTTASACARATQSLTCLCGSGALEDLGHLSQATTQTSLTPSLLAQPGIHS